MVCYNQAMSVLHGSLISCTQPTTDQAILLCVRQAMLEIVRNCKNEDEQDTVRREMHIFLLINTDVPWKEDLMENDVLSCLYGLVPKLSPQLYMTIVSNHNLWKYWVECVPYLPSSSLSELIDVSLAQQIFTTTLTPASSAILTGLAISCVSSARRNGGSQVKKVLTKVLEKFAKEILKDEKDELHMKSVHLLNVLVVIKSLCTQQEDENENLMKLYAFKKELASTVDTVFSSEIEGLLVIFKALACNFSFDSWISLTEISTNAILQQRDLVNYWTGEFAPSNMQLLLAHMQAECKQLLEDFSKLQKLEHVTEVLQIMTGFAQHYDRKVELNMDDFELETIFHQLSLSEGWKKQAYVDHLLEQELDNVLWNEAQLDIFLENAESLGPHVGKLLNHFLNIDKILLMKQKDLFGKIMDNLPDIEVEKIFTSFHSRFGLTKKLKREDFSQRFVSILNRASGSTLQESFIRKEFMVLAMEDGETVVKELFNEASNNKGKVDACIMLLLYLVNVCKVESDQVPLFSSLVTEFISDRKNCGRSFENVVFMAMSVLQSEPCFSPDIIEGVVDAVWTQIHHYQIDSVTNLTDMLLGIIKKPQVESFLEDTLKLKVCVCFITILNNVEGLSLSMEKVFKLKGDTLEIIGLLVRNSPFKAKLIDVLNRENVTYFSHVNSPTLLDYIHYTNWEKDMKLFSTALSPAKLSTQLVSCLPKLLLSEWKSLQAVLELVCPNVEVLTTIIDCLVLSLESSDPGLGHYMVLALCSHITSTSDQDTLVMVVRELFMMLEVVTEEQREVIWPCIHNTVGKYLSLQSGNQDSLVREIVAMTFMTGKCEERDMLVRMLQQSLV